MTGEQAAVTRPSAEVVAAREALFAGGLPFGAADPGLGVREGGQPSRPVATMDGAKYDGVILPASRDKLAVFEGFLAGLLAGEDYLSGQGMLLGVGGFSQKRTIEARERQSILGR